MRRSSLLVCLCLLACSNEGSTLNGTWTFHESNVVCTSQPADTSVTITQSGTTLTLNAQGVVFTGTVDGSIVAFSSAEGNGIGVPAGDCTYSGSVDPSGASMTGTFGCECVNGNWTATR
jgi:hypothetical protein